MDSYSVLAKYYDKLMGDFNYNEIASFILEQNLGKCGLELGSGSGEITIPLAEAGYNMTAVDMSTEMLDIAQKKALKKALNIRFLCEDIVELDLDKQFDFIVAICDVFNYINNEELAIVLDKCYNMLKPNGTLVFDVSSEYKLKEVLGNNIYFEEYDDFSYFWQNELDEKENAVDMDLVFFIKDKNGKYDREEETQTQYYVSKQNLLKMLDKFSKVEVFDDNFNKVKKDSTRLFFKVVK